ncbi:MAG: preprotein translocase subunit SecA [Spirochaetes bacterium]|nr:preprotein translocase subunit SecA [Spirochaetota bacterium]
MGFFNFLINRNKSLLKKYETYLLKINQLENELQQLTRDDFLKKTEKFIKMLQNGEDLDNLIIEGAALVREASKRTIKLRHFDVQILGALALYDNKIAEMKTGEGKTLVATIPLYLHSLTGKACHLVTVNDYLAKRDALWMGPIYLYLGRTVGVITSDKAYEVKLNENGESYIYECSKKHAYSCDIVYGTNNEFGFDYLRDNMVIDLEQKVQRGHYYAIIDEVDSVLIDEARTPLIISGPSEKNIDIYKTINSILVKLLNSGEFNECSKDEDGQYLKEIVGNVERFIDDGEYRLDEKSRNVILTERGLLKIERELKNKKLIREDSSIFEPENINWVSHTEIAMKAHKLYHNEVDYLIKDRQILIIDEFTGRILPGRRYSGGLHQAIEAKEGVPIQQENQTLATISFQNYFRLYEKLAGMTGTAKTEEEEFYKIYKLEVVVIPTNKPLIRIDHPDRIYRTLKEKEKAIINEIKRAHQKGQPILVGTISVEKSERLSSLLKREGINHQVLNAKYHEKEAMIIKEAGKPYAVTIATNMAGRGTDIKLGGEDEKERDFVIKTGGLYVIGTERHEARRIDNQLVGRSGRQGDPGESRFFISLEDDLMRLFGSERLSTLLQSIGYEEDMPIEHPLITRAIEKAQKRVENRNFEIRKHLLEYDDVLNKQRVYIYNLRDKILKNENLDIIIKENLEEFLWDILNEKNIKKSISTNEKYEIIYFLNKSFNIKLEENSEKFQTEFSKIFDINSFINYLMEILLNILKVKFSNLNEEDNNFIKKAILLNSLDSSWKEHLLNIDGLEDSIAFQAYSGKDPLIIYKFESYKLFENLLKQFRESSIKLLFLLQISKTPTNLIKEDTYIPSSLNHQEVSPFSLNNNIKYNENINGLNNKVPPNLENRIISSEKKNINPYKNIGRNDPCPCGSGKKFKNCHGRFL